MKTILQITKKDNTTKEITDLPPELRENPQEWLYQFELSNRNNLNKEGWKQMALFNENGIVGLIQNI